MSNEEHDVGGGQEFWPHERLLAGLGILTLIPMMAVAGVRETATLSLSAGVVLYFCGIISMRARPRLRLALGYLFTLWFYFSVAVIVPALGVPILDEYLMEFDRFVFGDTPAVLCEGLITPGMTDLMSGCYTAYLVYLHVVVVDLLFIVPTDTALERARPLFMTFVVGLAGYLLVPAIGPGKHAPELFHVALEGGLMTRVNAFIVGNGSSVYDVFPSLHVAVTCVLLHHDLRYRRLRFFVMLPVMIGLVMSTVYLRYHYGVDLLAGFALFGAVAGYERILGTVKTAVTSSSSEPPPPSL